MQEMHSKSPQDPLEFRTFGASNSFSTYSYNFATYSDSYWKPCFGHSIEISSVLLHGLQDFTLAPLKFPYAPPPPQYSCHV